MKRKLSAKWGHILLLIAIFSLAFLLRTYHLHWPLADWHSWRQADTAAVTRNFIKEGFHPFYPQFGSFWALNSYGPKNVHRYFFAEFPLYNILVYPLYRHWGVNLAAARLVSIFFSSLTVFSLYWLVSFYSGRGVALLAAFLWATMPYNVYYGRVIMPDPLHVFCGVTALAFLSYWRRRGSWGQLLAGAIFLALTILTKPYGIVLGAAVVGLLLLLPVKEIWRRRWQIIVLALVSLGPYLLWRWHINHYPEGQFGTDWLVNSTHIRFRPAFFRWLFYERLTKIMLGGGGLALFITGLLAPKKREEWLFYFSWLFGLLVFLFYFATGNVTHDYYQLPFVPLVVIFTSQGAWYWWRQAKTKWRFLWNGGIVISLLVMMLAIGWYETQGYWHINNWAIVKAGQAADKLLPKDAKVIAPYNNDSAFLYQVNRPGWPAVPEPVDKLIKRGATHYVSVSFDSLTRQLMKRCRVVKQTKSWVIIDLRQCQKGKS